MLTLSYHFHPPFSFFFFFYSYGAHRDLHSFPTRRSSDLASCRRNTDVALLRALPDPRSIANAGTILPRGLRRSEEHTSELQSRRDLVCRLLLEKKKKKRNKKQYKRRYKQMYYYNV